MLKVAEEACRIPSKPMEEYMLRDLVVKEDIMQKAHELANLISSSDEAQTFQQAEKMIQENKQIQTLISTIKKKQKEIVAFESFENPQMVAKIEAEMRQLEDELDRIPIVNQFKQTQDDLDYLLQMVISVIRDSVSDKISVEKGTSAAPASCSD